MIKLRQARKLQATLVRNYHRPSLLLTGVKFRATSVAKKKYKNSLHLKIHPWVSIGV